MRTFHKKDLEFEISALLLLIRIGDAYLIALSMKELVNISLDLKLEYLNISLRTPRYTPPINAKYLLGLNSQFNEWGF